MCEQEKEIVGFLKHQLHPFIVLGIIRDFASAHYWHS